MSTAIARADDLTPDRVALLKRTLCPDLSTDEMELFAGACRRFGLDPFAKQIYAIMRQAWNPATKRKEAKMTIQTGIDGFRLIAARTGDLDGQDGPYWCGPDGAWVDVWLSSEPPAAAKVTVYRKGCARGFTGVARFSEYVQAFDGKPSGLWAKMSATMIAKCAEALALRKAFPADLSGLYAAEEMDQADDRDQPTAVPVAVSITQPEPPKPTAAPAPNAAEKAAKAISAAPAPSGDPVTDTASLIALLYAKGWDWARLVSDVNAKFGTSYTLTGAWSKWEEKHRTAAVAALRNRPDHNSAADLSALLSQLAKRMGADPAAVFQRYAAAASLPESCIKPEDLSAEQLETACKSFRAKLESLPSQEKGGAK
jgi:phage recombination protein Bet